MIVLRLAGGLGNQIFQLLAALLLAERTDQSVFVLTEGLAHYAVPRTPEVLRLMHSERLVTAPDVSVPRWIRWLALRVRAGRWMPFAGICDGGFPASIDASHRKKHINLVDGYFQRGWSQTLLDQVLPTVRLQFPPDGMGIATDHDCLLHVRGGDFLRFKSHAFLGIDYYSHCITIAQAEGCRSFGVITDDPDYSNRMIAELFKRHPGIDIVLLADSSDALVDFTTLRHAKRRIIGNSTFAWWASAFDSSCAPTMSPDRFVRDIPRDFFLPFERIIPFPAARGDGWNVANQ
jgi:hypothetical protein